MAPPKPKKSRPTVSVSEESSVVQVLNSNEPLVATSSSGPSCAQMLNSSEPLVPVMAPSSESEAGSRDTTVTAASVTPASVTLTEDSSRDVKPRASGSSDRRTHYNVAEIRSHWNMAKLLKRLETISQCIQFAEERKLIPREKICSHHRKPMSLIDSGNTGQLGSFRCRKGNCRFKSVSRAKGTWFEHVRLPLDLIFHVMYMFSHSYSYLQVQIETTREDSETVLSTRTIADWFSNCRDTIIVYELEHQEAQGKIGGPGKIVQIEESKFGKGNRGRHIEGHWVLGMIEDGSDDLRLEVWDDSERSAETLVPLIQKHILEGTEIHTGSWGAYECLPQYGYIHKSANLSENKNKIVAPDGTHTQRIKSHWRHLKLLFQKDQFQGNFTDWLIEYSWRRRIRINHKDPFEELLTAIEYVYK